MSKLLIYTPNASPRLIYVLDWLFNEQLKTGYVLTYDPADITPGTFAISYGAHVENTFNIPDAGLLWGSGLKQHEVKTGNWDELPVLYASDAAPAQLPFDIFSAIFFLLSRYEEYYPFSADKHGRYPATESLLFQKGLLERPMIDEWVEKLRTLLSANHNLVIPEVHFSFQPSYDIDMAWSYKHKGFYRTAGAIARSISKGHISDVNKRTAVLSGKSNDPYDSFEWLTTLHQEHGLVPLYFILSSLKTTAFDKNISPRNPEMQALIKSLHKTGLVCLHPSYYSDTRPEFLHQEKQILEDITGSPIQASRQHYIKLKLPQTYRLLMSAGITDDYSMGYSTCLGFRAGTGQSFYWYDLLNEKTTQLRVHPFCFMDTSAHFDNNLDVTEAFERLNRMSTTLKKANSRLVTVFHNFSLGENREWQGWRNTYETFIKGLKEETIS